MAIQRWNVSTCEWSRHHRCLSHLQHSGGYIWYIWWFPKIGLPPVIIQMLVRLSIWNINHLATYRGSPILGNRHGCSDDNCHPRRFGPHLPGIPGQTSGTGGISLWGIPQARWLMEDSNIWMITRGTPNKDMKQETPRYKRKDHKVCLVNLIILTGTFARKFVGGSLKAM